MCPKAEIVSIEEYSTEYSRLHHRLEMVIMKYLNATDKTLYKSGGATVSIRDKKSVGSQGR